MGLKYTWVLIRAETLQIHFRTYLIFKRSYKMRLTPPKNITWWIAVVLGVLGLLGTLTTIAFVSPNAFWFVFAAFALLAIATLVKDL